ncbi:LuxR C-terminal-related transcriptional regulator [Kitasatospora sp. NPDC101155]|uniref:LuxR C-terminal-related transcriptional regulator n=1 Tax=Kitasatospora sp. NPDC101155 TaxID=3364097 RepID=UPI00382711E2
MTIFTRYIDGQPYEVNGSDVVLVNLPLPNREALGLVTRLRRQGHAVILLSASEAQSDVVLAIQAGARGYLSMRTEEKQLLTAIRIVASGRGYVSAGLTGLGTPTSPLRITDREMQILWLVASGATDREIAEKLKISEHTVHSHLDRLRDKTGSRRRADLTRFALEHSESDKSSDEG